MITTVFNLQRCFRRSIWAHKELLNFPPATSVFFPVSFLISVMLLCLASLRSEQNVRIKTRTRISLLLPSIGIKKRVSCSLSWSVHTRVTWTHVIQNTRLTLLKDQSSFIHYSDQELLISDIIAYFILCVWVILRGFFLHKSIILWYKNK